VKVLHAQTIQSPDALDRFHREVRAAAMLDHPNIVAAYDADESGGIHFLVMEFVQGHNLATLVRRRAVPVSCAVDYTLQAARGLEYAHRRGVIHRDIKPANLLLDEQGRVKVLDLGLARLELPRATGGDAETCDFLTQAGEIFGTVDYMSPEQALSSANADARSDIYSLGCTLFHLLAGKPPYEGRSAVEKIFAHSGNAVPSLRERRGDVPAALDAVVRKMMAKKVQYRYQAMAEVVSALEPFVDSAHPVHLSDRYDEGPDADAPTINYGPAEPQASSGPVPIASQGAARVAEPPPITILERFVDGCGGPDKFLAISEEHTIFRRGGELALTLSEIETLLEEKCRTGGWTRQSALTSELASMLKEVTHNDGGIDQQQFERIVNYAVERHMPRRCADEHCITLILDNDYRPRESFFNKWFAKKLRHYGIR
jgi:serine/threonine protein kinase